MPPCSSQRYNMQQPPMRDPLHPCPNPSCRKRIFVSQANLNKHFGQKPACLAYATALLHAQLKENGLLCLASQEHNVHHANQSLLDPPMEEEEEEDDAFAMADTSLHMDDYENYGFNHLDEADDLNLPG